MQTYQTRERIQIRKNKNDFLLTNRNGDVVGRANATAVLLLALCETPKTIADICADIVAQFEFDNQSSVSSEVADCLRSLAHLGAVKVIDPHVYSFGDEEKNFIDNQIRFRLGEFADRKINMRKNPSDELGRVEIYDGIIRYPSMGSAPKRLVRMGYALSRLELSESTIVLDANFKSDLKLVKAGPEKPYFRQGRPVKNRYIIIWPMPPFHDIQSWQFGSDISKQDTLWSEKIPKAIWRGSDTGQVLEDKTWEQVVESMGQPQKVTIAYDGSSQWKANRLHLVCQYINHPEIDVGITRVLRARRYRKEIENLGYKKPALSQGELLKYKYLIAVEGHDTASQLAWSLASTSVVLMPQDTWETHVNMGLEAWNHYVPIEDIGFSDLPGKLEWCKLHDKECREISCRATEYMRPFFNQGIENTICQGVMDYYEENLTLI